MLLVIDVGNTNIVLGLMSGGEVIERWRVTTVTRTTDEFGLTLLELLRHAGHELAAIEGVIVSNVVPSTLFNIEKACRRYLEVEPLVVGKALKTGMRVRTDNPREVGSDRIVNCVAALETWEPPLVVIDFGTATTFDCVNDQGDYVGGAIAPGIVISAEALFSKTSKLPRVEVKKPRSPIGTNTVTAMQSGLFYGYVGLVDHLARCCKEALGGGLRCVATGGFSNLIGRACGEIDDVDEYLTLRGLSKLFARNRPRR